MRLIYPAQCGICKLALGLHDRELCPACRKKLVQLRRDPVQAIMSQRFAAVANAWSIYPYEGPVRDLLTAVKFSGKQWLISAFRSELRELSQALAADNSYDAVIPVPMDRRHYVEREFNQAELLAAIVSQASGIPLERRILSKRFSLTRQSSLGREARRHNLRDAFRARSKRVRGQRLLLVDDILTTGATSQEAATTLRLAGARQVDLLVLARTEASDSPRAASL